MSPSHLELLDGYRRYQAIRRMTPREFTELWEACLKEGKRFDEEVDVYTRKKRLLWREQKQVA